MKRVAQSVSVAALAVVLWAPAPVLALELVPGGYGAQPGGSRDASVETGVAADATPPPLALDFTPRGGAALWARPGSEGEDRPSLSFDLTVRAGESDWIDRFGLGTSHDALLTSKDSSRSALTVGGAMRWSDWTVGGGLGRAYVLGEDVDLMAATLGYGRVQAEVAYGQAESIQGPPSEVLMLSTDLAAWSWLTLESDLALGARGAGVDGERDRDREPVAAGRFGLRLNF